jgi:hypothetical protein
LQVVHGVELSFGGVVVVEDEQATIHVVRRSSAAR